MRNHFYYKWLCDRIGKCNSGSNGILEIVGLYGRNPGSLTVFLLTTNLNRHFRIEGWCEKVNEKLIIACLYRKNEASLCLYWHTGRPRPASVKAGWTSRPVILRFLWPKNLAKRRPRRLKPSPPTGSANRRIRMKRDPCVGCFLYISAYDILHVQIYPNQLNGRAQKD